MRIRLTGKRFKIKDTFQHMIGSFLLAGPFIVEGGTWDMARTMADHQAAILIAITFSIGYAALYKADPDRDPDTEASLFGVPVRYLSLMAVSYSAVIILMLLLSGPQTYGTTPIETARAISIAGVFSVVGAAAADSYF